MNLIFDLKYALRLLKKSWGYSLMCAVVIAFSVGIVVFSYELLYSQLLKPLGFPGSEHWYSVQIATEGKRGLPIVDAYTYQELLKSNRSVDYLGAFTTESESSNGNPVVLSEGQASTPVRAVAITPRLLAATRVPALKGRVLDERDAHPGATPVAILSYDAWQTYFAGDPAVIGKTTRIDSSPVQIVGVMPREFFFFQDSEVWRPLPMPNLTRPSASGLLLAPMIVVHENQNVNALLSEMQPVVDRVNRDYPDIYKSTRRVELYPALRWITHLQTTVVSIICVMAAALLLLGSVNISMVFLARLLERSRELALRNALGASRARLLRQSLLETAFIVLLGLLGGWAVAAASIRWGRGLGEFFAQTLAVGRYPNLPTVRPSDMIMAVIAATTIWLVSTLIPAWRISKQEASAVLAGSGKGTSSGGSHKTVGPIVGLQVLVSSFVLVTCATMVLAVNEEVSKPTGLSTTQVMLTTSPTVFDARYAEPAKRLRYWQDLETAVESKIPGAQVTFTTAPPMLPSPVPASIETEQRSKNEGTSMLPSNVVSENYFNLLGLKLRSGRLFDSTDDSRSLRVAIIDEHLAARHWPGQEAVGKRVRLKPANNGPWLTIVGVVSSARGEPYSQIDGVLYQPLRQAVPSQFHLLVKLPNIISDNRAMLRAAAFAVDRDLPLQNLQMHDVYMAARYLRFTGVVHLFTAITIIAALLAASGLFGLISHSVVQRTHEVGIRRALGATSWQATSMFARQGALYLTVGVVGVGLAIVVLPALSRSIPNILDRVVLTTLGVVLLNVLVILAASYFPARRAMALELGDALRYE